MEHTSGNRESRARPRERDPDRHPRPDRDRHPERQRDRAGDRRRERNGGGRRDGDRDRGRDREPRQDRHRAGDHRSGEQRVWEQSRQSRTRDGPRRPTWDAAPPPWPAPWETPDPPPLRKDGLGRRGPESEPTSGRYPLSTPRPGLEEVEYYQSEAEGLLECHKCRYLCTGRAPGLALPTIKKIWFVRVKKILPYGSHDLTFGAQIMMEKIVKGELGQCNKEIVKKKKKKKG
ncbi:hypothetical protein J1605_006730 [Eschrichtius robustus]|uniref:Uncharacterized protein n=1 Tax=Eschrichtius robustus TaxID=9764 RepID=A0AB34H4F4_ESCRO|nr:hypothetical protein J1605_006730 [Eschrichtius robustus]